VAPLSAAALDAALIPRAAPAHSAQCSAPTTGASSSPTTVPAKGNQVSIVAAPATVGFPALNGSAPRYTKFSAAPPFCIDATKTYTAAIQTDVGTITITLLSKYAPQSVDNFVFLAGYHYYDGTVFHRVIPGFMDQGGDPTGSGTGSPGYTIADEYPKSAAAYDNGAVAMANTGQPHTGGSQFFLVSGTGGQQLTPAYSVFGQITGGLGVAKQINDDGNSNQSASGVPPKVTHKIIKVTITES
jgi:cyclophilin family peptidyl-prolyl cis-trans isomerase